MPHAFGRTGEAGALISPAAYAATRRAMCRRYTAGSPETGCGRLECSASLSGRRTSRHIDEVHAKSRYKKARPKMPGIAMAVNVGPSRRGRTANNPGNPDAAAQRTVGGI
jgi:hypothetical protein